MQPRSLIATLILALVAAAALFLGVAAWRWLTAERPAEIVAERFDPVEGPAPSPAMQACLDRIRLNAAMAFDIGFFARPMPPFAMTSGQVPPRDALRLALSLPPPPAPAVAEGAGQPVPLPAPRPRRPPPYIPDDRVFNEAQVASLRDRLALSAGQAPLWAAVETELRGLTWRRPAPRTAGQPTLDPAALQRLNFAYERLDQVLREEQRRQMKLMLGIVGL